MLMVLVCGLAEMVSLIWVSKLQFSFNLTCITITTVDAQADNAAASCFAICRHDAL